MKKGSYKTPEDFDKDITNEYINSGIGVNGISINTSINTLRVDEYIKFGNELSKFIGAVATNRMEHPVYKVLRNASKKLCVPNLVLNIEEKGLKYETKTNLIKKLKIQDKFTILEKISSSIDISIVYSVQRCKKGDYDIIAIPLGVSTNKKNINHANILVIDMRNQVLLKNNYKVYTTKKKTKKKINKYTEKFKCYLFEPNGTEFSKSKGITSTVKKYIENANKIFKKIDSKYELGQLEIVGGEGLQTELGGKIRKGKITVGKRGYPICGAIGYWLIYIWLNKFNNFTIKDCITILFNMIRKSKNDRGEIKLQILNFIEWVRKYNERNYKNILKEKIKENVNEYLQINNHYKNFSNKFYLTITYQIKSTVNEKFNFNDKITITNKGILS